MKVRLAEGRMLRDPRTKVLIDADRVREVPDASGYWRRRLRDGDVVIVEEEEHPHRHRAVPRHEEGAQ